MRPETFEEIGGYPRNEEGRVANRKKMYKRPSPNKSRFGFEDEDNDEDEGVGGRTPVALDIDNGDGEQILISEAGGIETASGSSKENTEVVKDEQSGSELPQDEFSRLKGALEKDEAGEMSLGEVGQLLDLSEEVFAQQSLLEMHSTLQKIQAILEDNHEGLSTDVKEKLQRKLDAFEGIAAEENRQAFQRRKSGEGDVVEDTVITPSLEASDTSESGEDLNFEMNSRQPFSMIVKGSPVPVEGVEGEYTLSAEREEFVHGLRQEMESAVAEAPSLREARGEATEVLVKEEWLPELLELEKIEQALSDLKGREQERLKEIRDKERELADLQEKSRGIMVALGIKKISGAHAEEESNLKQELADLSVAVEVIRESIANLENKRLELENIVNAAHEPAAFKELQESLIEVKEIQEEASEESARETQEETPEEEIPEEIPVEAMSEGAQEGSEREGKLYQAFQKEFGLSKADLESIEGFGSLPIEKKFLVLENSRQLTLERVSETARDTLEKERAEGSFLKKLRLGFFESWQLAKREKKIAQKLKEGGLEEHRAIVQEMVKSAANSPQVSFETDAKGKERLQVSFFDENGLSFADEGEAQAAIAIFQGASQALAKIPMEYSYTEANEQQKQVYMAAKYHFTQAKTRLLGIKLSEDSQQEGKLLLLQKINDAETNIEMRRFFNHHPDADGAIIKMADESLLKRGFGLLWRDVKKGNKTENVLYFGGGLFVRPAVATAIGAAAAAAAAPALGAIFGAWRGKRQARSEIATIDRKQREGKIPEFDEIESKIKNANKEKKLLEEQIALSESDPGNKDLLVDVADLKTMLDQKVQELKALKQQRKELREKYEQKGAKNSVNSERVSEKLEGLIEQYLAVFDVSSDFEGDKAEKTQKKIDQIKAKLRTRIEYTKKKLEAGLVTFDGKERGENGDAHALDAATAQVVRVVQQTRLMTALARAEGFALVEGEEYTYSAKKSPRFIDGTRIDGPPEENSEKWIEKSSRRLEKLLDEKEEDIRDARSEYTKKLALRGMAIGAGFGLAGSAIRWAAENGFLGDWLHHATSPGHVASETGAMTGGHTHGIPDEVLPTQPGTPIKIDVPHTEIPAEAAPIRVSPGSGSSILGEMQKRGQNGQEAYRHLLEFFQSQNPEASHTQILKMVRDAGRIQSADITLNPDGSIQELHTIPLRGAHALHLSRMHSVDASVLQYTAAEPATDFGVTPLDATHSTQVLPSQGNPTWNALFQDVPQNGQSELPVNPTSNSEISYSGGRIEGNPDIVDRLEPFSIDHGTNVAENHVSAPHTLHEGSDHSISTQPEAVSQQPSPEQLAKINERLKFEHPRVMKQTLHKIYGAHHDDPVRKIEFVRTLKEKSLPMIIKEGDVVGGLDDEQRSALAGIRITAEETLGKRIGSPGRGEKALNYLDRITRLMIREKISSNQDLLSEIS